jgi:hypothetical protein
MLHERNPFAQLLVATVLYAAVALLLTGCDRLPGPPQPLSMEPNIGTRSASTPVTIHGTGFSLTVRADLSGGTVDVNGKFVARLGEVDLLDVNYVDSSTLTAVVPAGLNEGVHDLMVQNPDGQTGSLEKAFAVSQCLEDSHCRNLCSSQFACVSELCVFGPVDKDDDEDGHIDAECVGGDDCDDSPAECGADCFPGNTAPDGCDGFDQDCDGDLDEDFVVDASCGVGYCRTTNTPSSCTDGVEVACVPGDPLSENDATCDAKDDDCDGQLDEDAESIVEWYRDADGDGFTGDDTIISCADPDGAAGIHWVDTPTVDDCDDANPSIFHGTACDDAVACTNQDICRAGVCQGYSTSSCGTCTGDCGASCGDGDCCVKTCSGTDCGCNSACSCDQTCTGGGECEGRCEAGSVCRLAGGNDVGRVINVCVDATCSLVCNANGGNCRQTCTDTGVCDTQAFGNAGVCRSVCRDNSTCTALCDSVGGNCVNVCADNATCHMTCRNPIGNCKAEVEDTANALIECINVGGVVDLQLCGNLTACGDGVWACNRACP